MLIAPSTLTFSLSDHLFLSFIAPGRSSKLHPVSPQRKFNCLLFSQHVCAHVEMSSS